MDIGYHITVFGASTYVCCITVHICGFNYGILDFLSLLIFIQILEGSLPAIAFIQLQDFSCYCASICIQLDFYFSHSFSVLVVAVVPALAYRNVYLIWRIFVRYYITVFGISAYACCITVHICGFNYGILDLLSLLIFIQILEGSLPAIAFIQLQDFSCYCASICIQLDFYFSHSFSVLVVAVVPALAYRNVYLIWRIFVRYYITVFGISAYACCITVHICGFNYGILDLLSLLIFIQILEGSLPAIAFIQLQDFSCYCASICIQLDFYFSHSFSVLVVAVVPALAYRNVYHLWCTFIRNYKSLSCISCNIRFRIIIHFNFLNSIGN